MKLLFIVLLSFSFELSFGQTEPISDSIKYCGEIYQDTNNYCDGSAFKAIRYLNDNFLSIGVSEKQVINILGANSPKSGIVHRRTNEMDRITENWIKEDYDYYIPYMYDLYCFDNEIEYFPSTHIWLFFKDGKLVGKGLKTYG